MPIPIILSSNLRLRDCINKVPDLINKAIELGYTTIAITDHECLSNSMVIEHEINRIKETNPNFKIVRGNEIYLVRNGLNADNYSSDFDRYFHFILLARDAIGHQQLREISSRAWYRSYVARRMRRVPTYYQDLWDIIGANSGHIIGSTACLGGCLPTQLLRWKESKSDELYNKICIWIQQMDNLFGHGNFYFELQPSKDNDQIFVNKKLIELSKEYNIPYIITTDAHYLRPEDRKIHKAYLNSQNGDREVDDFYATTFLMTTDEIKSYFTYLSDEELNIAFNNINNIASKCENYSLSKNLKIPKLLWNKHYHISNVEEWFELIPYLKKFSESEYIEDRELVEAIISGIESHDDLQNEQAYNEINSNLEMTWISSEVNKARWSAYYLNLQKIIDLCWESNSLVGPGRGSGVGFLLLYVLGITQINPLRESTRCFSWRFLNPERVSVLDIDFDSEGGRRADILKKFREVYGDDKVANVATFRQEKSKSAIQTAARGLGIDVDVASYISSLIPADRGQLRSLDQCMYGDEENDWKPIKQFVIEMTENYPELWEVAHKIEGIIAGYGIHAGGVIFVDEPFTNSTALMRAPDGTIITQFELHAAEEVSLIKYDVLSVEAMDKIHNCIDLLCGYGYIERKSTLKETYESVIGIYKIERNDPKMWRMVWNHEIQSLFQMEKQSGISGIEALHPTSVDDLAILNSTIRLMAQEKGGEMPTEKLARFKRNPYEWDKELEDHNLGEPEKKLLEPVLGMSYGLCIAQEQFMELVQLPELGGFNLTWADKLRKSIAKKSPKDYDKLTKEFFKVAEEKNINLDLADYVWNTLIAMSRGYGFNQSHTLAYSLIGLQEMNLAYKFPIIFWNCACLISEAGGIESQEEIEEDTVETEEITYFNEMEEFGEDDKEEDIEDSYDEDEDCDGYPVEVCKMKTGQKKKKSKTTNYDKVAAAIGKFKSNGINISSPDINNSSFTFTPDVINNTIRYGMSGITRISEDLVKTIIENRPYISIEDFLQKVKVNKLQMINLIKSGMFDNLTDRTTAMKIYLQKESGAKKRLTLQNANMLIKMDLISDELEFEKKVFNFNKYLKKFKDTDYYKLDNIAMHFYENNFNIDILTSDNSCESGFKISQSKWKQIYDKYMDKIRSFIKSNHDRLLVELNNQLIADLWSKYAKGSISKWEMDSLSCYIHEHELININMEYYGLDRWVDIPKEPIIDRIIPIKGKRIPLYKLQRICGTVLGRDKSKKTVTLLTTDGVVIIKIYGGVFEQYDRQLSEKGPDGKKHVVQKSLFTRGNKIIVTGIRQDDSFLAKTYSKTPYHKVELITDILEDGRLIIQHERPEVE